MCLIYCSIKIGRCQEINLVPRVPSYLSPSPSLCAGQVGEDPENEAAYEIF